MIRLIFLGMLLFSFGWAEVEPLSLNKSMEIAMENNHSLLIAAKKELSAKEDIQRAKATLLPTLGLETTGQSIAMVEDNIYGAKFVLNHPLFTGGKVSAGYKIILYNYELAEYEYAKTKEGLVLDVKKAYYGILKAQKLLEVAKESVRQIEAHQTIAKSYYEVGMVAKIDLLKVEVQLANSLQNLVRAENALKLANAGFNNLLRRNQDAPVEVIDILEAKPVGLDLASCLEKAETNRPELKQIQVVLKMQEEKVKLAKSEYYPLISAYGNWGYEKGKMPTGKWEDSWVVGLAANLKLWDWGATKSKVKEAQIDSEELEEQLSLIKNGIELETRAAYLSLEEAEKNINVAQKSIGQAEENLRITGQMYKEGASTTTEVLDAQTLLAQTKANYYTALYDYNLALACLEKATGE